MKVKVTAKGYNVNSDTLAESVMETSAKNDELGYRVGKLLYTFEQSGYRLNTHEAYVEFMKDLTKIDLRDISQRYKTILSGRFGDTKLTISLSTNV